MGTRRITNKNYHPVKEPVRAFYLAVRRFLASRNSREKGKIRLSKTLLKRAVIISNFSEREKLALMIAIDAPNRPDIERVLNNLIIPSH